MSVGTVKRSSSRKHPPKPPPPGHTLVDGVAWNNANPIVRGLHAADCRLIDHLRVVRKDPRTDHAWTEGDDAAAGTLIEASYPLSAEQREQAQALIACGEKAWKDAEEYERRMTPASEKQGTNEADFEVAEFSLACLSRHPDNREPSAESIAEKAASMAADGQLEPLVIRPLETPGRFQILSGETRTLAAKKLGWKTIKARVIECDDARAQELLSDFNAHRKDLTPIEQARRILRLCDPKEKGGAGLTRDQAAKKVGLKDGASASNLVRLLELPKKWQDRVSSGELPQSYARELVPLVAVPAALEELERDWKDYASDERTYDCAFQSRAELAEAAEVLLEDNTQRLDQKWRASSKHREAVGGGEHPIAFDIEPHREELQIITITVRDGYGPKRKTKQVEAIANLELFEKLQVAALKAKQLKQAKAVGRATDGAEAAERPAKSKAEIEHGKRQRAAQLERGVREWRERFQRRQIAEAIGRTQRKKPNPQLLKLVFHFLIDGAASKYAMRHALAIRSGDAYQRITAGCAKMDPLEHLQSLGAELCAQLVSTPAESNGAGISAVHLDRATLEALLAEWECDQLAAWRKMQAGKDPSVEEFFQLHRKGELIPLGKELGVFLQESDGKDVMIRKLLVRDVPLPLPQCLQGEKPRKKGGK